MKWIRTTRIVYRQELKILTTFNPCSSAIRSIMITSDHRTQEDVFQRVDDFV